MLICLIQLFAQTLRLLLVLDDMSGKKVDAPILWEEAYENIRTMRSERNAPVDSVGCEKIISKGSDSEKVRRFHCLVSLMLSSQTKDEVNHAAMERLRSRGLTVEGILSLEDKELEGLIYPVGFYKRKTIYLKKVCEILKRDYDYDIPKTVDDLKKLPGVGPKMAYLVMDIAWHETVGIGVDTHVHRICNRLKWTGLNGTKNPEDTRKHLEDWLPQSHWREINWLLVGFGQQTCLPVGPKCGECLNKSLCPFGIQKLNSPKAKGSSKNKQSKKPEK